MRGSIGLVEGTYVVNLRAVRPADGVALAEQSVSANGQRALLSQLEAAAIGLKQSLIAKLRPTSAGAGRLSPRWWATVPLGLGIAAGVVAAVLLGSAESKALALARLDGVAVMGAPDDFAARARGERTAGVASVVGGGVLVALAAVLFLALPEQSVALSLTQDGFLASASWRWP